MLGILIQDPENHLKNPENHDIFYENDPENPEFDHKFLLDTLFWQVMVEITFEKNSHFARI